EDVVVGGGPSDEHHHAVGRDEATRDRAALEEALVGVGRPRRAFPRHDALGVRSAFSVAWSWIALPIAWRARPMNSFRLSAAQLRLVSRRGSVPWNCGATKRAKSS